MAYIRHVETAFEIRPLALIRDFLLSTKLVLRLKELKVEEIRHHCGSCLYRRQTKQLTKQSGHWSQTSASFGILPIFLNDGLRCDSTSHEGKCRDKDVENFTFSVYSSNYVPNGRYLISVHCCCQSTTRIKINANNEKESPNLF